MDGAAVFPGRGNRLDSAEGISFLFTGPEQLPALALDSNE